MSDPSVDNVLPLFISPNKTSSPFYFHHIANPENTLLRIQVIGPNLEFQFSHKRARSLFGPSAIGRQLDRKTAGFLALVNPKGERIVLTAAESGHGCGKYGDVLDAEPGVLANQLWARRVVAVAKLLGVSMRGPFDNFLGSTGDNEGIFQGSHVEVKLAVHGVFVLLSYFGITADFDKVRLHHLRSLRGVTWEDGSRPLLEIYFSRKNCARCGLLVRRLEEATGVRIRLAWKHRLQLKQYPKSNLKPTAPDEPRRPRPVVFDGIDDIDDQDMDFGDGLCEMVDLTAEEGDGDGDGDGDDVELLETVDLVSNPAITISPTPAPPHPADDFLDGLAYRVGQLESSPDGATAAIIQFANKMSGDRVRWLDSEPDLVGAASINKPLPATPKTEPPAWMLARADTARDAAAANSRPRREPSPDVDFEFPGRQESVSPCVRTAARERSPGQCSTGMPEKPTTNRRRPRLRSIFSVEIPARRSSAC